MYKVQYVRENDRERKSTMGKSQFLTLTEAERLAANRSTFNKFTYLVVDKYDGTIMSEWRHGAMVKRTQKKNSPPVNQRVE